DGRTLWRAAGDGPRSPDRRSGARGGGDAVRLLGRRRRRLSGADARLSAGALVRTRGGGAMGRAAAGAPLVETTPLSRVLPGGSRRLAAHGAGSGSAGRRGFLPGRRRGGARGRRRPRTRRDHRARTFPFSV